MEIRDNVPTSPVDILKNKIQNRRGKNMGKKITKIVSLLLAIMTVMSLIACIPVKVDAKDKAEITAEPEPITEPEPTAEPEPPLIPMQEITPETVPAVAPEINPADVAEPVAAENADTSAAHKNTDEEIEKVVATFGRNYLKGGYDPEKHKDAFLYATPCNFDDWYKVDKTNDQWIYHEVPLNIFVQDMGNVPSKYKTSKELGEEIGEDKMKEYSRAAAYFTDNIASVIPEDMNYEKQKFLFTDCGLPEAKAAQYAQEKVDYYNAHNYKRECCIRWSDYDIYRAVNGNLRSRLVYYAVIRDASDAYVEDAKFDRKETGKWIYFPAEVEILTDANGKILDMHLLQLSDAILATKEGTKTLEKWLKR